MRRTPGPAVSGEPANRRAGAGARRPFSRPAFFLAAAATAGLAAGLLEARSPEDGKPRTDPVTTALAKRLTTGANIDDVVVDIRWPFESRHVACRLSGSGVGLWDRQVQFRLPPPEVERLLRSVASSGFGSLPGTIGGEPELKRRQKGRLTLSVASATKAVVQLEGGEQSPKLQTLADAFLRASAAAASRGIRVSSFEQGLEMLAAGTLAAEALQVEVVRPARPSTGRPPEVWTLRLDGMRARLRFLTGSAVQRRARTLVVSKAEFQALVDLLRQSVPDAWPATFPSPRPADIRLQVLGQVRSAKSGPASGAIGAPPTGLDRVAEALLALRERVEKEGVPGG
jgi:hypothetical protein